MERRVLGKTGELLSVLGFGGLLVRDEPADVASRLVAQAVERGINYFDVAPSYGNSELVLGPALEPYRGSSFLACKTTERSRAGAWAELQQSLKYLRTDHFDLYQLHAVTTMDDVEEITAAGGALEAFLKARRQGLIRYIGFSTHAEEPALALMERFEFDSVLFPVNWVAWHEGGFGPRLMTRAEEQGIGRLALKALARRTLQAGEEEQWPKHWYWPVESAGEAEMALRFTLSQPITAALPPAHAELFGWAMDAADGFRPLTDAEAQEIPQRSAGIAALFPLAAA